MADKVEGCYPPYFNRLTAARRAHLVGRLAVSSRKSHRHAVAQRQSAGGGWGTINIGPSVSAELYW